jgi:hypothetical protein
MYMRGEGTDQSDQLAKEWFEKAAKQGHEGAKAALHTIDVGAKTAQLDPQRMSDVYAIAKLLEEYKAKKGHFPFYNPAPAKEGFVKTGTLVTIGSSQAEDELAKKPNPFHISAGRTYSSALASELKQGLGRDVVIPVEPQNEAVNAPNAYYAYFSTDDQFLVMAFLYYPNENTTQLFGPHSNLYAIASSDSVGEFWKSCGLKARKFSVMDKGQQ